MLPINFGSHADYQNFVTENLRKYYPNPDAIARSTWDIIERFWTLDLSIDFKVTSITDWDAQLKINPLYAILSGFEFGNTPGVGTFYDFLNRLWDSDDSYVCFSCLFLFISDNIHFSMFIASCA